MTIISVLRRYSTDFYYSRELRKSSVNRCDYNRPTYMVEDQQCVKNEDIFDSKYFNRMIAVMVLLCHDLGCLHVECRFALNDSLTSNRTIHMPWSRSGRHLDTGITIIDTNQEKSVSLNISLCKISSLEVYRGKLSVYEIEYSGFTLVDRNTIQVLIIITSNISWLRHNLPGVGGWGGSQSSVGLATCLYFAVGDRVPLLPDTHPVASHVNVHS